MGQDDILVLFQSVPFSCLYQQLFLKELKKTLFMNYIADRLATQRLLCNNSTPTSNYDGSLCTMTTDRVFVI